jgi:glyoxylase-like metal-dependent hydrolase (beta-lactamase superfamily II)
MIRTVLAPNASALTLDGTRTYLVGRERIAVIDPGARARSHLDAVVNEIGDGVLTAVLLTHAHPDHAEGAGELARRLGTPLLTAVPAMLPTLPAGALPDGLRTGGAQDDRALSGNTIKVAALTDGTLIPTDAGDLVALATPGHTPDHFTFHLPAASAVFVGDLMLGGMETALVAAPEGDLGAYLASLERVRALDAKVLYPAHGPPFTDPPAAIDAYVRHRLDRERQVLDALRSGAGSVRDVVAAVYGPELAPSLAGAAGGAVRAYLEHLAATGRIRREGEQRWVVV